MIILLIILAVLLVIQTYRVAYWEDRYYILSHEIFGDDNA